MKQRTIIDSISAPTDLLSNIFERAELTNCGSFLYLPVVQDLEAVVAEDF